MKQTKSLESDVSQEARWAVPKILRDDRLAAALCNLICDAIDPSGGHCTGVCERALLETHHTIEAAYVAGVEAERAR